MWKTFTIKAVFQTLTLFTFEGSGIAGLCVHVTSLFFILHNSVKSSNAYGNQAIWALYQSWKNNIGTIVLFYKRS